VCIRIVRTGYGFKSDDNQNNPRERTLVLLSTVQKGSTILLPDTLVAFEILHQICKCAKY
jgi:hypothetical protein